MLGEELLSFSLVFYICSMNILQKEIGRISQPIRAARNYNNSRDGKITNNLLLSVDEASVAWYNMAVNGLYVIN